MSKRNTGYSNIRALACMAIVVLHTFYAAVPGQGSDFLLRAGTYMVRNSMFWAVPCFVMVTGALLLDPDREVTWEKIFQRYLRRVVTALLFFSALFAVFDAVTNSTAFSLFLLKDWLVRLLTDTGWSHMWYLYLMIGLYILIPFFRMITASARDAEIRMLLLVFVIFLSLIPMIEKLTGMESGFYIWMQTGYPLYLFAGYALSKGIVRMRRRTALAAALAGLAMILLATWFGLSSETGTLTKLVGNYSFAGVILLAIGLFELIRKRSSRKRTVLTSVLSRIDRYSFGIYLIHMLYLKLIVVVLKIDLLSYGGLFGALAGSVVVFVLSLLTSAALMWLGHQIGKLKKSPGMAVLLLLSGVSAIALQTGVVSAKELNVKGAMGYAMIPTTVEDESGLFEFYLGEGDMFRIIREEGDLWLIEKGDLCGYIDSAYCMIDLADVMPDAVYEITNASASIFQSSGYALDGITGEMLYKTGKVWHSKIGRYEYLVPIMYSAAKKIAAAQMLASFDGLTLKIYDSYRPSVVTRRVRDALNALYYSNSTVAQNVDHSPDGSFWGQGWFLAQSQSSHNFGTAIDVSLAYADTGEELQMPCQMHELSTAAVKYTSPGSGNYSRTMNASAVLLDRYMEQVGMGTLDSEWWHFQDNDSLSRARRFCPGGCNFQAGEGMSLSGVIQK